MRKSDVYMTTIYLVRHAAAEGNLYRVAHGQFNSTITFQGYRQLAYLRKRFEGVTLDAVYSSDLLRAVTTASALYVPRGLEVIPEPRLREVCMGDWEQLTWGEVARRDAEMYYNFNNRPDLFRSDSAEAFTAVRDRMLDALRDIAARHPGGTVAATSHGAALRILLGTLQGLSLEEIGATPYGDNTAVSLVEVDGDEMRLIYRDDASHVPQKNKVHRHGVSGKEGYTVVATQPGLWFTPVSGTENELTLEARLGEELVGYTAFRPEKDALYITRFELLPQWRGQRYSMQLLGQAVKHARLRSLEDVAVCCGEEWIPYFEHFGFTRGENGTMRLDLRRVIRPIPELDTP